MVTKNGRIDPIERALALRKTLKQDDRVMVVDFSDTLQGKDTSRVIDLMPNVHTGDHVFRAKVNIKEIDPIAAKTYGAEFHDVRKLSDCEIESFVRRQDFDFPLWYKHDPGFEMKRILDYNPPFIAQVAGCNFHDGTETGGCWYCFVDDKSNDGRVGKGKVTLGAGEMIDSMLAARGKIHKAYSQLGHDLQIKVLRVSGGEPTIVLDWVLDIWRQVSERGLDLVGQLDSNLSTGSLVEEFERRGIYEPNTLEKLAEHPVKVLTAIKGTDVQNIQDNVQSTATMPEQIKSIKMILNAGLDIYPQMYNPNPQTLGAYLSMMEEHIENFALRVHLGPLKVYGPNTQRLEAAARRFGQDPAELLAEKKKEWDDNYSRGCEVMDRFLLGRHGVGYKQVTRSDVPLKILK